MRDPTRTVREKDLLSMERRAVSQTEREVEAVLYVVSHLNPSMALSRLLTQPNVRPTSGLSSHVELPTESSGTVYLDNTAQCSRRHRTSCNVKPEVFYNADACAALKRRISPGLAYVSTALKSSFRSALNANSSTQIQVALVRCLATRRSRCLRCPLYEAKRAWTVGSVTVLLLPS